MESKILKTLFVLVLLAFSTSGQNPQQHLICKTVENVFADTHNAQTLPQLRRVQGSPGKRGPPGSKGDRGPPGVRGRRGSRASVDYERISEMIDEKHSQGLRDIYSRHEEMQRNFTNLQSGLQEIYSRLEKMQGNCTNLHSGLQDIYSRLEKMQGNYTNLYSEAEVLTKGAPSIVNLNRCDGENGIVYEGKCYFAPYISSSRSVFYDQAVKKCTLASATIAEIHSLKQQKTLENFLRSKIPSTASYVDLWVGTSYQMSHNNLRFRSGRVVSIDQFDWYPGYPSRSHRRTIKFRIRKDNDDSKEGFLNELDYLDLNGVVCER